MPKKTKREKLRADRLRNAHPILPSVAIQTNNIPREVVSASTPFSFQINPTHITSISRHEVSSVDSIEFGAIKQDIVKTILLAAIAVSVEILLYWKIGR